MKARRIYLATSTNNRLIDNVLAAMRAQGHEVYDFRRGETKIFDPDRKTWTPADFNKALTAPVANRQFHADRAALDACDCVVLLTPCGNDAHAEAGYAHGQNVPVIVFLGEGFKPGLMARFFNGFVATERDLFFALSCVVSRDAAATSDLTASARGLDPIDHPLDGQPDNAFRIVKKLFEFPAPSQEGPARRGPYPGADHE